MMFYTYRLMVFIGVAHFIRLCFKDEIISIKRGC
jgi:hypothetical protein